MANIDFQKLFDTLKDEVTNLALSAVNKYKNEAKKDALALMDKMKENLSTWTLQLADGKLSQKDFEFLVLGQKELIEMSALKQVGLSKIKMDELKNNILNLVVKTASGLI